MKTPSSPSHIGRPFLAAALALALLFGLAGNGVCQEKKTDSGDEGPNLAARVVATANALKTVTDVESAKKAAPALIIWRDLPFQTEDPAEAELVNARIAGDPLLQQALAMFGGEMQRISQLDNETFVIVAEALTGTASIDLKQHFGELTKSLKTVKDLPSARAAVADLEKWGQPAFEVIEKNVQRFNEEFGSDLELQQIFQVYGAEIERINQLGDEVAGIVRNATVGKERSERMTRKAEEAAAMATLLNTQNNAMQMVTALKNYFTEYRRHPWKNDAGGDLTLTSDAEFHRTLAGEDDVRNPRRVAFLALPESVVNEDGAVVDSWGRPFRVFLDTDYDTLLTLPAEYGSGVEIRASMAIDSAGADGKFETPEDNITTWKEVTR